MNWFPAILFSASLTHSKTTGFPLSSRYAPCYNFQIKQINLIKSTKSCLHASIIFQKQQIIMLQINCMNYKSETKNK